MDYTPRHAQPVTLAQLRQLEPELLTNEIARLENSIQHLKSSNVELKAWAGEGPDAAGGGGGNGDADEVDEETRREFALAVQENEETIASQRERLTMIRLALEEKIGVYATNPHYQRAAPGQAASTQAETTGVEAPLNPEPAGRRREGQSPPSLNGALGGQSRQAPGSDGGDDDGMYL